jgi:hypothetical protein
MNSNADDAASEVQTVAPRIGGNGWWMVDPGRRNAMAWQKQLVGGTLLGIMTLTLAACGNTGVGAPQKPQFILPKNKRVLIMVDVQQGVEVPAGFTQNLGDGVGLQLYKYDAIDKVVAQNRLAELRKDEERFAKLGVADIARETESDIVIFIDVVNFHINMLSDESITQGVAQCLVKVIDSQGKRLWPSSDTNGAPIEVTADPVFADSRNRAATEKLMIQRMARDVGRLFRKWQRNEEGMRKTDRN